VFFWNIGQVLMTLINWLLKLKCMLNFFFFWSFLCCMKIQYDLFIFCFLETWSYAWKQRHVSFFMFWWKPGILIPDLYFYGIKIQPDINQNDVEKCTGKSQIFPKWFLNFFYFFKLIWVGPGLPILIWANYTGWASATGLDSA